MTPGDGNLEVNDGIAVARDEAQDNLQAELAQQISQVTMFKFSTLLFY